MKPVIPDLFGAFTGFTSRIEGLAQLERVRRGMWVHSYTPRPPVGQTPHEVVWRHDKLAVRYYAPREKTKLSPVVLVPSMINRAYILDLEPGRSLVQALSSLGHPTYLIDWGIPGPEDAREDVAYVLFELLHRAMDRICRHGTSRRVHLFGYCMGGTLAAMYVALRPNWVRSFCALATPVKFAAGGRFRDFVAPLDVDAALDSEGLVPVSVMKPAFKLLDPMGNWNKYLGLEWASHHPLTLARALARERWLEENVPISGAFAKEFILAAYQEDRLIDGTWEIRGEKVDLQNIDCPTLVVVCEKDFITPPKAALPLADVVGASVVRTELLPVGHIGVVVGSKGPQVFYPLLDSWFGATSDRN